MVLHFGGLDARGIEVGNQLFHNVGVRTRVVANVDMSVALVAHLSRAGLCRTDESQAGGKPQTGEHLLDIRFQTDAVLDEQYQRLGVEKRRKQFGKQSVAGGFQRHDDHICLGHVVYGTVDVGTGQVKGAVAGFHMEAVLPYILVVAVQEKVYVVSCIGQPSAVISAYCTGSYYRVFHCFCL